MIAYNAIAFRPTVQLDDLSTYLPTDSYSTPSARDGPCNYQRPLVNAEAGYHE
jgi:hypothetical protein